MSNQLNFNLNVDSGSAVSSINTFFQTFEQGAAKAKAVLNKELGEPLQKDVIITMKGGKAAAQEIQSVNQTSQKLGQAAKALNGEWGKTPNALRQQLQILKEIQGNTQKYASGTGKVTAEWKKIKEAIDAANKKLKGFGPGAIEGIKNSLEGTIGKFAVVQTLANLGTAAIMGLGRAIGEIGVQGAQMEVLNLQLEAFTGSAENAQMAMKSFIDTAVKTPFNVEQVANAGRIMLGFGLTTEEAIRSTERLAVAASATDGDLNNLARNLGQIQAQGRAYTRDLTQFAIQGIPIWQQMADVTGKTTVELKKMAEDGAIGFEIVQAAMASATREGSAFWELAQRMQDTFKGRLEQVVTQLQLMGAAFVKAVQDFDASTGLISGAFDLIINGIKGTSGVIKTLGDNMKGIVSITGGVAAAMLALTAAKVISGWGGIAEGIKKTVAAFKALNIVTKLNAMLEAVRLALSGPKGWAILAGAVAIGVGAYIGLNKVMDDHIEKKAKEEEARNKAKESYQNQKDRMEELVALYGEEEGRVMALTERMEELKQRFESGEMTADEYKTALQGIEDEMKGLQSVADGTADKIKGLEKAMESLKAERETKMEGFDEALKAIDNEKQANDRRHEDVMDGYREQKDAINDKADVAKRAVEDEARAEDARHKAAMRGIEEEGKAKMRAIEGSIEQARATADANIAALNAQKEAAQRAGDAAIQSLQNQKTAMQAQHDARMSQIRAQGEAAISSLEKQKQKIDEITAAQLDAARQLSPAEKELAAIRKAKLEATARDASLSREQRLEAQAQLDQMARQAYEAKIQEEAKQRQKVLDEQIAKQKEIQAAMEEKAQKAFDARLAQMEKAIQQQEQANANQIAALETQIQKEKEQSDARIKALEEEKKKLQESIENAKQQEQDRHDAVKTQLDEEKRAIEDKKKADIDAIDEGMKKEEERKKQQDRNFEDQKKQIQNEKDAYEKSHKERMKQLQDQKNEIENQGKAVDQVNGRVQNLKGSYDNLTVSIREARLEAEKLAAAQASKQNAAQQSSNQQTIDYYTKAAARFAGGPVTGGASYTVNELGKEAFLSASGKLSMINAPSFGTWTAPSSGTVIPAHLTSQLSIPRGGINLNGNVRNSAAAAGASGGVGAMARALMNAQGGDRINNNVTIQSANTTKAASDILVELTKIRRRRYS